MRRVFLAMLAALASGLPAVPLAARAAAPVPHATVIDILTKYERGDYDRAVKQIQGVNEYGEDGLLFEFYRDSPAWIAAAGPDAAPRRQLIVATVAIEAAASHKYSTRPFIEFACEMLRAPAAPGAAPAPAPPGAVAERLWFLTSVALLENQQDWTFLNGAPVGPNGSFVGTWVPMDTGSIQLGHLMHGEARLPDEPRFALARAIGVEYSTRTVTDSRRQTILAADLIAAEIIDVNSRLTAVRVAGVKRAMSLFEPLVSNTDVGAEARLHLGFCQLRLGDDDDAIASFGDAEARAKGSWIQYQASLLHGWALDRVGRHGDAAAAYRAALAAVPRARTAVVLLTASLILNGRAADAEAVSTGFLADSTVAVDPWPQYFTGDGWRYTRLLAQLREAIK